MNGSTSSRGCILGIGRSLAGDTALLKFIRQRCLGYTPCAAMSMKLNLPPSYENVEYPPERRKLKPFLRVPIMPPNQKPAKMQKDLFLMRGPELIHNKLQYGEYGVQAVGGGCLRYGHIEMIRLTINRKMDESVMFAMWRIDQLWKPITKKGQGKRMGSGKGNIDHYVFPLRAGRIIVEMGGHCEFEEVQKILTQVAKLLPFKARVVTRTMLQEEKDEEEKLAKKNINPFTFEYCSKNNFLGSHKWLSPYDFMWKGKYH